MLIVGLTGGIATGKSTVVRLFEKRGAYRIDTDLLARKAVEPSQPAWREIVRTFGEGILEENGTLDRKKLAAMVFSDNTLRHTLNRITHPPIRALLHKELARARESGARVALVEVPLLYEAGFENEVDCVVVVTTDAAVQLKRLMERDGLSAEQAQLRIAAQMPLAEKAVRADYCIDNGGTAGDTEKQVSEVWNRLLQEC